MSMHLDTWEKVVIGVVTVMLGVIGWLCWRVFQRVAAAFREGLGE